jgi:hypothetical protein
MNLHVALRQLDKLPEALLLTRKNLPHVLPLARYKLAIEESNLLPLPQVTFVMLKWGKKYPSLYLKTLIHSLLRFTASLSNQYLISIVCFTDDISDSTLTSAGPVYYRFEYNRLLSV